MKTKLILASLLLCCLGLLAATAPEKYLKLTGGTMTGPIYFNGSQVSISSAENQGKEYLLIQTNEGGFYISAGAGSIAVAPSLGMSMASTGYSMEVGEGPVSFHAGSFKITKALNVYSSNAAAITGGLVAGNLYRTGGDPDVVAIVH